MLSPGSQEVVVQVRFAGPVQAQVVGEQVELLRYGQSSTTELPSFDTMLLLSGKDFVSMTDARYRTTQFLNIVTTTSRWSALRQWAS